MTCRPQHPAKARLRGKSTAGWVLPGGASLLSPRSAACVCVVVTSSGTCGPERTHPLIGGFGPTPADPSGLTSSSLSAKCPHLARDLKTESPLSKPSDREMIKGHNLGGSNGRGVPMFYLWPRGMAPSSPLCRAPHQKLGMGRDRLSGQLSEHLGAAGGPLHGHVWHVWLQRPRALGPMGPNLVQGPGQGQLLLQVQRG